MYLKACVGVLVLALALLCAPARADVLPPGCGSSATIAACMGKKAGDECTLSGGARGNCEALFCVNDGGQAPTECVASSGKGGCSMGKSDAGRYGALAAALILTGLVLRRRARFS